MVCVREILPANIAANKTLDHARDLAEVLPTVQLRRIHPSALNGSTDVCEESWTIGVSLEGELRKKYQLEEGGLWRKVASPPNVRLWQFAEAYVPNHTSMQELLVHIAARPEFCLIRAAVHPDSYLCRSHYRRWHPDFSHSREKDGGPLIDFPRRWIVADIDEIRIPEGLSYDDPHSLMSWMVDESLPAPFRGVTCVWQFSGSAGLKTGTGGQSSVHKTVKAHLFFRCREPIGCRDFHALLKHPSLNVIDRACGVGTQIIFTAAPELIGGADPLPQRVGVHHGISTEVDFGPLSEELRDEEAARAERKNRDPKARPMPAPSSHPAHGPWPYDDAWLRIAYNDLGARAAGYRKPIFRMVCVAVRRGERDFSAMKTRLRELIWHRFAEIGDEHKRNDVERYLSDHDLDEAITNATNYLYEETSQ